MKRSKRNRVIALIIVVVMILAAALGTAAAFGLSGQVTHAAETGGEKTAADDQNTAPEGAVDPAAAEEQSEQLPAEEPTGEPAGEVSEGGASTEHAGDENAGLPENVEQSEDAEPSEEKNTEIPEDLKDETLPEDPAAGDDASGELPAAAEEQEEKTDAEAEEETPEPQDEKSGETAEEPSDEKEDPSKTGGKSGKNKKKASSDSAKKEKKKNETLAETDDTPDAPASKYDPRPDKVSAIRDQYWGTCWAQTGIAVLESCLLTRGMESSDYQLSVEDMLWWARGTSSGKGGWNLQTRDDSLYPPAATGYLSTVGGRLESDIPYLGKPADGNKEGSLVYGEGQNQKPANYDSAAVQYEVTDIVFAKSATRDQIKQMIVDYGAVGAGCYASEDNSNFNPETSASWQATDDAYINHAVTVVGWDDGFPKEKFKKQNGKLPENNGAWIVKNSLGTQYGSDGGFIYISYEDVYLFHVENEYLSYLYSVAGVRPPQDQKRYMNDQFGAVKSLEETGNSAVWANVFDFGAKEKINELSFVSWSAGSEFKLYYAPMDGDVPNADEKTWKLLTEGIIGHAGYTTVASTLDEAVPKGKGAIVFAVSGGTPSVGTDEGVLTESGNKVLFSAIADENTAFTLRDGKFTPTEVERQGAVNTYMEKPDLSIRAYTVPYTGPETEPTAAPTVTPTAAPTVTPTAVPTAPPARPSIVPSAPSKAPALPASVPASSSASAVTRTGDDSVPWVFVLIIAGAAAVIAAVVIIRKRRQ